jgi:hypothetical protein
MSGGAGEVVIAVVRLLANASVKKIFAMRDGDADCVVVGSNEQSIGRQVSSQ